MITKDIVIVYIDFCFLNMFFSQVRTRGRKSNKIIVRFIGFCGLLVNILITTQRKYCSILSDLSLDIKQRGAGPYSKGPKVPKYLKNISQTINTLLLVEEEKMLISTILIRSHQNLGHMLRKQGFKGTYPIIFELYISKTTNIFKSITEHKLFRIKFRKLKMY